MRLILFPDSNFFVQCLTPEEINWSILGDSNEIELIVTTPVLRELDKHKNGPNDRLGRRSRRTYAMLRPLLLGEASRLDLKSASPRVTLTIRPELKPSAALENRLDYRERDDQLIGIVETFLASNPSSSAFLLTHDATPIANARAIKIPVTIIPDEWLSPPEVSEGGKKIRLLEAENTKLKNAEPKFGINAICNNTPIEEFTYTINEFTPLTADQISSFMRIIVNRFPIEKDFGPRTATREKPSDPISNFLNISNEYIPASDADISAYKNQKYPEWLKNCQKTLETFHEILNRKQDPLSFCFEAQNVGTRPAKDALVTIRADGPLKISPPRSDSARAQQKRRHDAELFSAPPQAPKGAWKAKVFGADLENLLTPYKPFGGTDTLLPLPLAARSHSIAAPDPNEFYYKPNRPSSPVDSIALECQQWRHGDSPEKFQGTISFKKGTLDIRGALQLRIQAENVSDIKTLTCPVKIRVFPADTYEQAAAAVSKLIR
jgi:hypothetical protein